MGRCNYCGKSGLFLSLDKRLLCSQCRPIIGKAITDMTKIAELCSLVMKDDSEKIEDQIIAAELFMKSFDYLLEISKKNIPIFENKTMKEMFDENEVYLLSLLYMKSIRESRKMHLSSNNNTANIRVNWNLPLNPGGKEPETKEEINAFHLEKWKKSRVVAVKSMCANDQYVCEYCRSMHQKIIPIDQAEPQHSKCTSPNGCRCYYQPVIKSQYEKYLKENHPL